MINSPLSDLFDFEEYTKICDVNVLKEKQGKRFLINNVEVALFKVEDNIYALSNICPHQQSATIFEGFIEDGCVVCPVHGWKFDLKTGNIASKSRGLDSFSVKIINGTVFVKVKGKKFNW